MNPSWVTVGLVAAGLLGNLLWTLVNLRIENKMLERIDSLKEWADGRYERRREARPVLLVDSADSAPVTAVSRPARASS